MKRRLLAALLTLACLMTLLPGTALAANTTNSEAVKAPSGKKLIALTFDDGPGPYTNRLLDGLAKRDVKVTFFLLGQCAENYDVTTKRIQTEGHQIASHTYDHPTLTSKSDSQVCWEVEHTADILNGITGLGTDYLLRPPYGDYNNRVLKLIDTPAILWSVDPLDWKYRDADTVCRNIVNGAFDGAIVLAHDIHSTTVDGALAAIDQLKDAGYEFVTVNELFRRRGVALESGDTYSSCKGDGSDLGPISKPVICEELYYGGSQVRITADKGAKIYYTTDGSKPTGRSAVYTGALQVKPGQTIRAFASFNLNGSNGPEAAYTVQKVALQQPTVRVAQGKIYLENPNRGTDLRYTTDGSVPTEASRCYTTPIPLYDGVLRFRVYASGGCTQPETFYVSKSGNLFRDVSQEAWYFDYIDRAVSLGLLQGTGDYYFEPNASLTRAMFVTVLARVLEVEPPKAQGFSDVQAGLWYTDTMAWAVREKLLEGYEDGSYRPNARITREQMCVILDRLLSQKLGNVKESSLTFADRADISPWAKKSVARVAGLGLMQGAEDNCFFPLRFATRAEATTVLLRLYDFLN